MNIGFFTVTEAYLEFARQMLESARAVMPDADVFQFTDGKCPALDGVDGVRRIEEDMPMAVMRMTHHSQCRGEWLFIDSDIILKRDVSRLFYDSFDVALTDRAGTFMEGTPYARAMPYNTGVVFSRCPRFWLTVLHFMEFQTPKHRHWEGDQMAIAQIAAMNHEFKIKVLPGRVYNYPPKTEDEDVEHAAILHFKGLRKLWLTPQKESATAEAR